MQSKEQCVQDFVEGSPKQAVGKMHAVLLPAVAKAANDPVPDVREAAMCVLVAFAIKAGSLALLDKVPFIHAYVAKLVAKGCCLDGIR